MTIPEGVYIEETIEKVEKENEDGTKETVEEKKEVNTGESGVIVL